MLDTLLNDILPYIGLGIPILLTGMGLPVPEEGLVIAAGIASHNDVFEPVPALLTCILAAMLGDCCMYGIGYHFGHGLIREHRWFARLFNPRAERKMEQRIRDHGLKVLFISRFLVGVRTPVYVAAGVLRIPFRQFIFCDLISASVVVSMFFGLSYRFAEQFNNIWQRVKRLEIAFIVAIVAAVVGVVVYFNIRHRRRMDRIRLRRLKRTERSATREPARVESNGEWPDARQQKVSSSQPSDPRA